MRHAIALALACTLTPALASAQEATPPTAPPAEPVDLDAAPPAPEASATVADQEVVIAGVGKDQEDRSSTLDTQRNKLEYDVFFETEWHEYDNLDFRALDESSDQAILDSDDRNGFAFTGVSLELGYKVDPSVRFVIGTSYRGLWGNDQIGNVNAFGGFLFFNSLYVEYTPAKGKYKPTFRLGRQRFSIGGMAGAREFILADNLDMLRVDLPLGDIGSIILVPINIIGASAQNDQINFVSYVGQSTTQVFGFRGDRMSRRYGGVVVINPEKLDALDVRAYAFYTEIGALGTGSDISYGGRLGNFADNDWVLNAGARASFEFADLVSIYGTFDASVGIDRKELVTNDVNTNGFAWGGGVVLNRVKQAPKTWGAHAEVGYFEAQGPAYLDNGQLYSHGYVGMKARQVGGIMANRFLGWHPTGYVGTFGVSNTPHDTARKAGTRVISADADIYFPGPVGLGVGYWFLQDTGISALDQDAVDTITPPFGYSREEYRAQSRLGKVLGHEIDGRLWVQASKALRLYAYGAVLLPGEFYATEIGRAAGTALGSSDPQIFWDAGAGVAIGFGSPR